MHLVDRIMPFVQGAIMIKGCRLTGNNCIPSAIASNSLAAALLLSITLILQCGQAHAAETVQQLRDSGATVVADPKTGVTRFVGFDKRTIANRAALAGANADATLQQMPADAAAAKHLANYGSLFGLQDSASETRSTKHRLSTDGRAMTRYQQHYQGIPVIAGELIINQNAQRQLSSISGKISPKLKLNTTPAFTAVQAQAIARTAMAKWYQLPADEFVVPEPQLSIYDSRLLSPHTDPVALVWRLDVTTKGRRPINEFMAINAKTGLIALHFNQVPHAMYRMTYDANSTSSLPGTLLCDESHPSTECQGVVNDAAFAHRYAKTTYDFYKSNFGRDGLDDLGSPIVSTVRYCEATGCPFSNGYWTGSLNQIVFGVNIPRAEDFVAHELTHGVTTSESNLAYYYQSGAINESLSDIFGEFVQQSSPLSTVTEASKWKIFEDLAPYNFWWGAYSRSMSNPTDKNQPDKMTSSNYHTGSDDQGGVHTNSGVGNKAAYLMTAGGQFNGVTVIGLGLTKVAQIYYQAQTHLLTSGSDYLDLYNALYQACQNLVGQSGIVATDCQQVRNATNAVEMNLSPVTHSNPESAMCPAGQVAVNTYKVNGFENSTSWTGTTGVWRRDTGYAQGGLYSLFGGGDTPSSDERAQFINPVVLPANAFLRFDHAFDFEEGFLSYYDGGIVEYSSSGGAWTQLTTATDGQGYTGVIYRLGDNALAGKNAFAGSSHGYVSTRFDLSALAGQSVQFGWRLGTDSTGSSWGWALDNWRIYTCQPGFELGFTTTGNGSGSVTSTPAGIDACSLPCKAGYTTGSSVTLAATAATGSVFAGWSGACTGMGACQVTMNSAKTVTANFTSINDGFPANNTLPIGWIQSSGSSDPWSVTNDPTHAGWSLRSGRIANSQQSSISYTTSFLAGNVSFARKVSSESCCDSLQFYIDGVFRGQWSGEVAWSQVSFPISAGTHTVMWRYVKDGSVTSGSDAAWIDSVVLPVAPPISCSLNAVPAQIQRGQSTTLTANCSPAAVTYSWTGVGCTDQTAATCTVTPAVTTNFSVTGTNGSGSNTASTLVTVKDSVDLTPILMLLLD